MISSGMRASEAARRVGRTSGWATQLTPRYNTLGVEAVADRRDDERKTGRVPTVEAELAVKLDAALHLSAPDGGLWTAKKVAAWIERETGRQLHATSAWRVLRSLGFTLQTVRPRHRQAASQQEQEVFKKNQVPPPANLRRSFPTRRSKFGARTKPDWDCSQFSGAVGENGQTDKLSSSNRATNGCGCMRQCIRVRGACFG